jgi:hypothetical protein
MRRQMEAVVAVAALGMAIATAPEASAQTATEGSRLAVPVEVELIEQAVCTIDEDSFLMSLVMRTTYSNTGVRPLFLSLNSERVSSMTFVRDSSSLDRGAPHDAITFRATGAAAAGLGDVVTAMPGWAVAGRVMVWLPVSIAPEPDAGSLVPGDYHAHGVLDVMGWIQPDGAAAGVVPDLVPIRAQTRPLVIRVAAPRQEQECGSSAVPLRSGDAS